MITTLAGLTGMGWSQTVIWTNPITDNNPSLFNPFTTGDVVVSGLTVSGIGRGVGMNGISAAMGRDRYNATGWDTAALDPVGYYSFTLTPASGREIDFTSFTYTGQASGSGPTSFAFRSSLSNFTTNIGAPMATGATINLTSPIYQNITTPISFRLYGWAAASGQGTFSVNDFRFNGAVPVPEPNAIVIGMAGLAFIFRRSRKRSCRIL